MIQYGLIGNPLTHSFSAEYFNKKFRNEGIDAAYRLYPLNSLQELHELIMQVPGLKGLNVTIPFKQSILNFLGTVSPEAEAIGAVNTLLINRSNQGFNLTGFNTDAPAFAAEIEDFAVNCRPQALILGTGGAAAAAAYVLRKMNFRLLMVTRNAPDHGNGFISYAELTGAIMNETGLIVNATPAGMFPSVNQKPEIPAHLINESHFIYDMIYNPEETLLMQEGRKRGARVSNGLGMLYRQAELAWDIWQHQAKK
jgi:shikimate dehydrogenase